MAKNFDKQGEWTQKVFPLIPVAVAIVFIIYSFFVKDSIAYSNFHPFHWEDGLGLIMFGIFTLHLMGVWFKIFNINPDKISHGTQALAWAFGVAGLLLTLIR